MPDFKIYQQHVIDNTKCLAACFKKNGYKLVSDGTDNHLFLVDLRPSKPDLSGKQAQELLEQNKITANRNTIPGETRSPFQTSGLRIGTAALTSRGMGLPEMELVGDLMHKTLNEENPLGNDEVRSSVEALCKRFPLPY